MIKERHVQGWLEKGMSAFSSVYQVSQAMWAVVLVFRIGTKQVLKCCVCFFLCWGCTLVSVGMGFKWVQRRAWPQCPVVCFDPSA